MKTMKTINPNGAMKATMRRVCLRERACRRPFWSWPFSRQEDPSVASLRSIVENQERFIGRAFKWLKLTASEHEKRRQQAKLNVQHTAILIDAENTSHNAIEMIMREAARFGVLSARRIYADWTSPQSQSWKNRLIEHAIVPIQQFSNTTGKNATDSTMIIDAMDLLYSKRYNTFVLVSSDADFTRLAIRLREDGMHVVGIGREQTPLAFTKACSTFVTLGGSVQHVQPSRGFKSAASTADPSKTNLRLGTAERKKVLANLAEVVRLTADDTGWSPLHEIGTQLRSRDPTCDPRAMGSASSLSKFMKSLPDDYEYTVRGTLAFVRPKARPSDDDTSTVAKAEVAACAR